MSEHVWVPTLWLDTFKTMLNEDMLDYGDEWTLNFNYRQTEKVTKEEKKRGWRACTCHAHGRFQCRSCKRKWPSARVGILFRYRLRSPRGIVMMRPFGQACRACEDSRFYLPGFTVENVEHVLLRLFRIIQEKCYGKKSGKQKKKPRHEPTEQHEKELCEACQMGLCCEKA